MVPPRGTVLGPPFVTETSAGRQTTVVAVGELTLLPICGSVSEAETLAVFAIVALHMLVVVGTLNPIVKVRRPPGIRVNVGPPHCISEPEELREHPPLWAGKKFALPRAEGIGSLRRTFVAVFGPVFVTVMV